MLASGAATAGMLASVAGSCTFSTVVSADASCACVCQRIEDEIHDGRKYVIGTGRDLSCLISLLNSIQPNQKNKTYPAKVGSVHSVAMDQG